MEQQPSRSSDAAVNPYKQGLEALSSPLFSRSESISSVQVCPFPKAQQRNNNKKRSQKRKSEILTDTPNKTVSAQAKSSKKVRLPKNIQYSLFYKNSPQDKKGRENQMPLLNKNGITWYVWTPIPIQVKRDLGAVFIMEKLGT